MRELHVVALSEDGRHVVLATSPGAGRGGFRVAVDDRLAAALRGELARPGQESPSDRAPSPKEIQARLRAGESPEQIAADAGMPLDKVERFSGPVLSERARVVDSARAAVLVRGRRGPSALPLGEAVEEQLLRTGTVRPGSVEWTSRRQDDGRWVVELTWVARARRRTAQWLWDPSTRHVVAADPASAALGHLDAAPPRRAAGARAGSVAPDTAAAPEAAAAKKAPAKKAPAKRAPAKKAPAAKASAKKVPAKKAPAAKAPAAKAPAAKAPAAKAPAAKAPAAKVPAKKVVAATSPSKAPAKKAAAAKTPATTPTAEAGRAATRAARQSATGTLPRTGRAGRAAAAAAPAPAPARKTPALRVVPSEPPEGEPAARTTAPRGRSSVPAWADVLLGTSSRGEQRED